MGDLVHLGAVPVRAVRAAVRKASVGAYVFISSGTAGEYIACEVAFRRAVLLSASWSERLRRDVVAVALPGGGLECVARNVLERHGIAPGLLGTTFRFATLKGLLKLAQPVCILPPEPDPAYVKAQATRARKRAAKLRVVR